MTKYYRVMTRLPFDSVAATDGAVNTFHFSSNEVGTQADDLTDIIAGVLAAYQAFDANLTENLAGTMDTKIYDLTHAPPRVPVITVINQTLTPAATSNANQLCVPVGIEAQQASGQPRGRRRGRVFIGPVSGGADTDDTGDVVIATSVRDAIGNAFGAWLPTFPTPTSLSTITWEVFSVSDALGLAVGQAQPSNEPTFSLAELALGMHPVDRVRIGNRFGVQRRRKSAVTNFLAYT